MSDIVSAAAQARQKLAQGLGALQNPGVPEALMAAAEPVARAMSALHTIEATQGATLADDSGAALAHLRQALTLLQSEGADHAAAEAATAAVAGALGVVHSLTQLRAPAHRDELPTPVGDSLAQAGERARSLPPVAPAAQFPAPAPQAAAPAQQPAVQQPAVQQPSPAGDVLPRQSGAERAGATASKPPGAGAHQPRISSMPPAATRRASNSNPPAGEAPRVKAELGAHSSSNFYKGLSGNDILEAGGIFVATYQALNPGDEVVLEVSLPGGYEFHATGVVRWTRDAGDASPHSPPGFGAQFTQISPEGRQLVHRYVRNREPLFHDDL